MTNITTTAEQTLAQLKAIKDEISHLLLQETELKTELEKQFTKNLISQKFISNGVMATRKRKEGKWAYSEFTHKFIADKKKEIELQMKSETENGIAKQNPPTYYWAIMEEKK